jgi:hypothetical protein
MNKCTGVKSDGSQCPMKGTCKSFQSGDPSLVMLAPFQITESGQFNCSSYTTITEQNLGSNDYGTGDMLNS